MLCQLLCAFLLLYPKILVFLGIKLKNLVLLSLEGTEQLYAMQLF